MIQEILKIQVIHQNQEIRQFQVNQDSMLHYQLHHQIHQFHHILLHHLPISLKQNLHTQQILHD